MGDFFNRNRKTLWSAAGVAAGVYLAGARGDVIKLTLGALLGAYAAQMFMPSARAPEPVVENPTTDEVLNQT
jgi:hypothetical protein